MKTYTLTTKAIDDKGNEYTVTLSDSGNLKDDTFDNLILDINSTPASWYLSTLVETTPEFGRVFYRISIHGNNWICENISELMDEALEIWSRVYQCLLRS